MSGAACKLIAACVRDARQTFVVCFEVADKAKHSISQGLAFPLT